MTKDKCPFCGARDVNGKPHFRFHQCYEEEISQLQSRIEELESWLADSEGATTNAIALTKENAQLQEKLDEAIKQISALTQVGVDQEKIIKAWREYGKYLATMVPNVYRVRLDGYQKLKDLGEI